MSEKLANDSDLAAVTAIVRRAGTSFYRGMRILPPDRRAAMYAIYAFCREVDDVADEPAPAEQKQAELARWRDRVEALYRGQSDGPLTRVLGAAIGHFALRREDFLAIIDGMQADADTDIVAPSAAALDLYCDQVASAVGRLSVRAFGDGSARADEVAFHLGRALQFTNILRDLGEDAARGRLYLPAELLDRHRVPHDAAGALKAPGLAAACAEFAAAAETHFTAAAAEMEFCDPTAMRPARMMGDTYHALLKRLIAGGFADPAARVSLSRWQKLKIAAKYAF